MTEKDKIHLRNLLWEIVERILNELEDLVDEEIYEFVDDLADYCESTEGDNDGESEGGEDDYE